MLVRGISSSPVAASHGHTAASTYSGGASMVGRGVGPVGQPRSSGHRCSRGRGCGIVSVTVGGGTLGLAYSVGALSMSIVAPVHGDTVQLDGDNDSAND